MEAKVVEIIKGASQELPFTVYSEWVGQVEGSALANITGSTIKFMAKQRLTDPDSAAVIDKSGTVVDGPNGEGKIVFNASDTNSLSYTSLQYEILVKMAGGTGYQRTGVGTLILLPNLIKTLP